MARASSSGLSSVLRGGADTIVARATAVGRGALAIVRLSGTRVSEILERVCPDVRMDLPWRAQLARVLGVEGQWLDEAVVIPYRKPRSFTGEDMAELVVHGSPAIIDQVMEACAAAGARGAEPGEFSRRAVANGKMDLVQAEGLRDLIDADTFWQARLARGQAAGELSARIAEIRSAIVDLLAVLEASLDFPPEEVAVDETMVEGRRQACLGRVEALLATADVARRVRDGARVVICGRPNSGKSTLFNGLLARERAIVSPRPGTTRDVLEAEVEIAGVPVVLVDTAGLQSGHDEVEAEGVRRAEDEVRRADVVLLLWAADDRELPLQRAEAEQETIRLRSKADLEGEERSAAVDGWLEVSARTGQGMERLHGLLRQVVGEGVEGCGDGIGVAQRHRLALEEVRGQLDACAGAATELAAEHLRWALEALARLTGEVTEEEVLDVVFSTFCLGK